MTRSTLLAVSLCVGSALAQTALGDPPAVALGPKGPGLAAKARALYFTGDTLKAAEAFEAAVKVSSDDWRLWADGAVNWAESGRPDKAVAWYRRAAAINDDALTRTDIGWALLRAAEPESADAQFARALSADPDSAWALLGAGRTKLALGRPSEAVEILRQAAQAAPGRSLADYYLGMAYEKIGNEPAAAEAFKRAVGADSYFHEGRRTLARSYLRQRRYNEAWKQLSKLVEADPGSKLARAVLGKIRPLLTRSAKPSSAEAPGGAVPLPAHDTEAWGDKMPSLRVGVSSTAMGNPRARLSVAVHGNGDWKAVDPKSGRVLLTSNSGDTWVLRLVPANKKKKKSRSRLELRGPNGRVAAVPGDTVLIVPADYASCALTIENDRGHDPRVFRGEIELALFNSRRTIRIVNIIGLEDYTHGVVSVEMPARSPLEALKAQAVLARTHAYFIKTVMKRHKKEGYDLCDEQHCQVYNGLRAETERTRAVVKDTRGRVAVYKGKPAYVIYSSHCGGRTQSGVDLGWGNVPYWKSVSDAPTPEPVPTSPLELRRLLSDWPQGFDRPSSYVHAAHARWTRVVSVKSLEERLNHKFKIGKLKGLRVLRRAPSGHVDTLLILGSKRNHTLTDEMAIRSLLAVGSLRSTLFVIDVEYRKEFSPALKAAKGKKASKPVPVLVPDTLVFHGGGWGHCVGLCQSGAMGRAEAGQDYETIVKAYFAGVGIGTLDY